MAADVDTAVEARLKFGPLESPYGGVLEACARIREGMAMLDKYVGAIERDAGSLANRSTAARYDVVAASEGREPWDNQDAPEAAGASFDAPEPAKPPPSPTARDGKSWKR